MPRLQLYTHESVTTLALYGQLHNQFAVSSEREGDLHVSRHPPREQQSHLWIWLESERVDAAQRAHLPPDLHQAFSVEFEGIELLKEVLVLLADSDHVWVFLQEAQGSPLFPGLELIRILRERPDWNLGF